MLTRTHDNSFKKAAVPEDRKAVYVMLEMNEKPRKILTVAADENGVPGNSVQQKNNQLGRMKLDRVKCVQTLGKAVPLLTVTVL